MDIIDNTEELNQKIKQLNSKDKPKAVALKYLLDQRSKLDDGMEDEIKELQRKYDELAKPIFDRALDLINGLIAPSQDDLKSIEKYLTLEELEKIKDYTPVATEIPNYWLQVLKTADIEEQLKITERDEDALKSLKRVESIYSKKDDYTIKFYFSQNEFFTNQVLEKSFIHDVKGQLIKTTSSKIEWKEGFNFTRKIVKKKQKNKKSGVQRVISKEVDADSFFLFFRNLELIEKEKMDEELLNELQDKLEMDQELGSLITDELIPYSIEYYLGIKQEEPPQDQEEEKIKQGIEDGDFSDDDEEDKKIAPKKKGGK